MTVFQENCLGMANRKMDENSSTTSSTNTKKKGVTCNHCGLVFPHRRDLKTHKEEAHSGERVGCPKCNKTFTTKSSLRLHIESIHEGVRYACAVCGKSFGQVGSLRRHMNSLHAGHALIDSAQIEQVRHVSPLRSIENVDFPATQQTVKKTGLSTVKRRSSSIENHAPVFHQEDPFVKRRKYSMHDNDSDSESSVITTATASSTCQDIAACSMRKEQPIIEFDPLESKAIATLVFLRIGAASLF